MADLDSTQANKLLCLITGPSGSGKTCIALELQKRLSNATTTTTTTTTGTNRERNRRVSAVVIHQDRYFTKPFLPYKERVDDLYENGSGIDWDGLLADVQYQFKEENRGGDGNKINSSDDGGTKIVIVEGHLIGNVAALLKQRFFVCKDIAVIAVLLTGCSQETCKRRRLERKRDRSEDEQKELATYIDAFVWPSFIDFGVDAMDTLRRHVIGAATTETTKATDQDGYGSKVHQEDTTVSQKSGGVVFEIDNSEGSSLEANVDKISNWIQKNIIFD